MIKGERRTFTISKTLLAVFSICLISLFLQLTVQGQQRQPDRNFQPGNAYAISDIESINTTNGNLNLNIPLASLPKGRGTSPGYTLGLIYNSKLWDGRQETREDGQQDETGNTTYHLEMLNQAEQGGWHWALAHSLKFINRLDTQAPIPCQLSGDIQKNAYMYKVSLENPSGGETQFKPLGFSDMFGDGFYNVDAFGNTGNWGSTTVGDGSVSCNYVVNHTVTTGMHYGADDNSGARLFIPSQTPGAAETLRWTLYYPDGTVIEHAPTDDSSILERITDRNGSHVVVKVDTFNGAAATKIADDVGHVIYIQALPTDSSITVVYTQGVGGTYLGTQIKWKGLFVYRRYRAIPANPPFGAPIENPNPDQIEQTLYGNFNSVESITLPTQAGSLKYEFTYAADETYPTGENYTQSGWGELTSIKLPSAAKTDYTYSTPYLNASDEILKNHVEDKTLSYKDKYDNVETDQTQTWHYNITDTSATITGPDGGQTTQYFKGTWRNVTSWDRGLVYATQNPDGTSSQKLWLNKNLVKTELTGVGNQTAIKNYTYDSNGRVTNVKEYEFVLASSISFDSNGDVIMPNGAELKRETINTYYNPTISNFDSLLKLKGLIKSTEIRDGLGTPVSRSEFIYDNENTTGNLKETLVWDSIKGNIGGGLTTGSGGNAISSKATYDIFGNPLTTTDPMGVVTTITYGCIDGSTSCVAAFQNLYPTKTEAASNYSSLKRTSTTQYDFYTGLPTLVTDVDNDVSTATTYDDLGRPTKVAAAVGKPEEVWTQTVYDDTYQMVIVKSDLETKGDAKKVTTQFYDPLGRVRLTKTLEDAASQSAINEEDGIKVQTRYQTIGDYNYQLTSNPYRAANTSAALSEQTMGWTRSKTSNDGRHSEVEAFIATDGLPYPWGTNLNSTGVTTTDIRGNRVLVSDQAGKKRISQSNAFGQLTDVWEIIPSSDAASVPVVNVTDTSTLNAYRTSYTYNTLGNLTGVSQPIGSTGGQSRSFTYSSLSRLKTATNPEMGTTPTNGTISYVYDDNGNLLTKTDPRGVQTTYIYDKLNRVTQRSYSNEPSGQASTPTVTYTYGTIGAITNAVGKLTKVVTGSISSPFSVTDYQAFDKLGRVTQSQQSTDGTTYPAQTYTYNIGGALIEEKYPSGRIVKNVLDASGDLSVVLSKKVSGYGYWNYANSFNYTAAGAVSSMQLGNFRSESTSFNSRLQPTQIALGTTPGATDLLKLNYDYGTTQNNGNILSQTITVQAVGSNPGFTNVQAYSYDALNRLKQANEKPFGYVQSDCNLHPDKCWTQSFSYDRFGNRNFDEANTTTNPAFQKNCISNTVLCSDEHKVHNPDILAGNKFKPDQDNDGTDDYRYDAGGNTTRDVYKDVSGTIGYRKYTYDGENKQIKAETINSGGTVTGRLGEYWYDGDGKRVKKLTYDQYDQPKETTIFVYDASGREVAEYSTIIATQQDAKVNYLTNDNLGSPRINTDQNGAVIARHDYQPFGEELTSDQSSQRVTGLGYGSDDVRKKFTGYELDDETELNFAQARYQNATSGRFNSPDPYNIILEVKAEKNEAKAKEKLNSYIDIPQQWNRFSYVLNNPLKYIDPTGEIFELIGTEAERKRAFEWLRKALGDEAGKKLSYVQDGGRFYVKFSGSDEDANHLGEVINALIDSESLTTFNVTVEDKVKLLNGQTINLDDFSGAYTGSISKGTNQIFINFNAVNKANSSAETLDERGDDGNILKHTIETIVSHELGHAWGNVRDNTFERIQIASQCQRCFRQVENIRQQNKDRSLIAENVTRQRLGLPSRRTHY